MAAERTRGTKTQSLSLRLDPKTKFILDFMARIRGQSITTVVERAIKEAAERTTIGEDRDELRTWVGFWDPSEGVRTLKLLQDPDYPTTYDEDELMAFTKVHDVFFYAGRRGNLLRRGYIEVLWPQIDKYLETWREKKSEDYWAAGEAMMAALSGAGLATPDWPLKAPAKSPPSLDTRESDDSDDEIPF